MNPESSEASLADDGVTDARLVNVSGRYVAGPR